MYTSVYAATACMFAVMVLLYPLNNFCCTYVICNYKLALHIIKYENIKIKIVFIGFKLQDMVLQKYLTDFLRTKIYLSACMNGLKAVDTIY